MSQAKGYNAQLLMDFEPSFGVNPSGTFGMKMPVVSSNLKSKQNLIESAQISGSRDAVAPLPGNIDVTGTVVVPVDIEAFGYWLKAMFGGYTKTGAAPSVEHTFKLAGTQPSFLIEQGYPDIDVYQLYNGCKVSKFTLNLGGDGELTASLDIMGAKETIPDPYATINASPVTFAAPRFSNCQVTSVKEGGVDFGSVVNLGLTVEFGLQGENYTLGGGGFRTSIPEGQVKVTGNLKALFNGKDLLEKAFRAEPSAIAFKMVNAGASLEFQLPEVIFERNAPGIEGSKGILLDLPFRAFTSGGSNGSIIAKLTNGKASY